LLMLLGFLSFISIFFSVFFFVGSIFGGPLESGPFGQQITCVEGAFRIGNSPICGSLEHHWSQFITNPFLRAPIGMAMMIVGGILLGVGRRGIAGSGMILNPRQARQDLEPFNRAAGGMVQDMLEEIPTLQGVLGDQQVIKVRCPNCHALNDEPDKFCGQCGKPL
jgi:zinc-ribbon domain